MADLYQNKYRVPTTRVNWHDYNNGVYFVTICTQQRKHYFGDILPNDNTMHLSSLGKYCDECIKQIEKRWNGVKVREYQVMPNHIHLIIDCKETKNYDTSQRKNSLLSLIIGTLKSGITREAHKQNIPFGWQTRFHEHIIREKDKYNQIAQYIIHNVETWATDCLNNNEDNQETP